VGISFKSKVLDSVAVSCGKSGIVLGQINNTGVLFSIFAYVVLHDAFANGWDVEETMDEVGGPEVVGGTVCDIIAVHAHGFKGLPNLVRQVTDDRLL